MLSVSYICLQDDCIRLLLDWLIGPLHVDYLCCFILLGGHLADDWGMIRVR